ncbi:MAG: hypothetical protein AB8G96_04570 [Phycisphaerales bacterium]
MSSGAKCAHEQDAADPRRQRGDVRMACVRVCAAWVRRLTCDVRAVRSPSAPTTSFTHKDAATATSNGQRSRRGGDLAFRAEGEGGNQSLPPDYLAV